MSQVAIIGQDKASRLRAWDSTGGTTTYFIYDQFGNPVLETKSGSVSAINTFGTNGLISRDVISGADTFYQFDPQGNTVTRSNNSATILDYHGSDPYGDQYASASSSDPYQGFGAQWGYYYDSVTGVSLLGHRYYDPAYARFLNQDPIGFGGGINVYSYAGNNPTEIIDPSGLSPQSPLSTSTVHAIVNEAEYMAMWGLGPPDCAKFVRGLLDQFGVPAPPGVSDTWALWYKSNPVGLALYTRVPNNGDPPPGTIVCIGKGDELYGHIMLIGKRKTLGKHEYFEVIAASLGSHPAQASWKRAGSPMTDPWPARDGPISLFAPKPGH